MRSVAYVTAWYVQQDADQAQKELKKKEEEPASTERKSFAAMRKEAEEKLKE